MARILGDGRDGGSLVTLQITQLAMVAWEAVALPWLLAASVLASWIWQADRAVVPSPSWFTPALVGSVTESILWMAALTAYWNPAKVALIALITYAFQWLVAMAILGAARQLYALIAVLTSPARMAAENHSKSSF